MRVVILCIVLFLLEDSSARLSHFGNEFYLACTPNLDENQRCIFSISTIEPNPVRVSISHKCAHSNVVCRTSVSVTQGQATTYNLSRLLVLSLNNGVRHQQYNRGVHFKAEDNKNISIVFLNDQYGTADAYLGIPVHRPSSREYVYYAISAPQSLLLVREKSFIAIVSTMDNTAVTVTPGDTYLLHFYTLSGEVNCSSATHCFLPRKGTTITIADSTDLTGRKVVTDKPITFLTGHQCADMPANIGNCDHMVEQIPPVSNWGRNFILAPLHSRKAYVYRVVASQNDTSVKVVCRSQRGSNQTNDTRILQAGSFHQATVNTAEGYCFVSANLPVLTVQYCLGFKYEESNRRSITESDPFLVQIPAIEQYSNINKLVFLNTSNIISHPYSTLYVTITIPSAYYQPDDILINRVSLRTKIQKGDASVGYVSNADRVIQGYAAVIVVPRGTESFDIQHRNPSAVLGTIVYAYGFQKSYGYVGSLGLNKDISVIPTSPPTTTTPTSTLPEHCRKRPKTTVTCWKGMDSLLYIPEGQSANLVIERKGSADFLIPNDCFRITTLEGTATKGIDYQVNESCCYEKNSRQANCPIRILKDDIDEEEEESFRVVLSSFHDRQCVCAGKNAIIRVKIGNISTTSDDSMSGALSAGISAVISVVVVLVIIIPIGVALLVFFVCKRKRKHRQGNMMTPERSAKAAINPPGLILPSNTVRYTDLSWLPSADNWEVDWSNFELEDKIGSGNYGSVYKGRLDMAFDCQRIRSYKQEMITKGKSTYTIAVKISKGGLEREEIEAFLSEIAMMKRVSEGNNPHVVKMVGCVATMLPLALLLEYVPHGNLREFLKHCKPMNQTKGVNINGEFEEDSDDGYINKNSLPMGDITDDTVTAVLLGSKDFLSFGYQIASGMEYLTSLDVIHRDLACRNVLVDANMVLKISDFGLARNSKLYMSAMKDKLPLRWMAPETFTTNTFNEQSDVWSYGVCLWEIYTYGDVPYKELPIAVILPRVVSGYRLKKPEICPNKVYTIMEKCWCYSSDKRPDFKSTRTMFEGMISQESGVQYTTIIT